MMVKKQPQNYPFVVETELKNQASGVSRSKGVPLSEALRRFMRALVRGDKRALSIMEEETKK